MNVGGMRGDWFSYSEHTLASGEKLPIATIKPEKREELEAYAQSMREQQMATGKPYEKPSLSEEQLELLGGKYDLQSMSKAEYQQLLEDLTDMGVLEGQDRFLIGGAINGNLVPLLPGTQVSVRDHSAAWENGEPPSFTFPENAKEADITDWVRYRATYETCYIGRGNVHYKGREAELFQTVADVFTAMEAARAD